MRPAVVERLQSYLGQDLRALSKDEQIKFDDLIGRLAPDAKVFQRPDPPRTWNPMDWLTHLRAKPSSGLTRSWYLWRVVDGQGRSRLVLFQATPPWYMPGDSSARIFVFDVDGRRLSNCDFSTGWRITIENARWLEDSGHGFPCLVVCSAPDLGGPDLASQYYAFFEDSFILVRIEDNTGAIVPVDYRSPNYIGPSVPGRTAQQWEAALRSSDRAEVLRTLVWLGGHHSDPAFRGDGVTVERFEQASLVLEARARPGLRQAVEDLANSEDRWVREAARQAREAIRGSGDR